MKRKQIEELLRKEAEEHTPDVYSAVLRDAETDEGNVLLFPTDESVKKRKKKGRENAPRRKTLKRVTAVCLAAALCLAIVIPVAVSLSNGSDRVIDGNTDTVIDGDDTNNNTNDGSDNNTNNTNDSTNATTLSVSDVYAIGAVTTASLAESTLGNGSGMSALASTAAISAGQTGRPLAITTSLSSAITLAAEQTGIDQSEQVHEYIKMLESFFGNDMIETTTETNTDSVYSAYETKQTVTGKDLYGNAISYVMYYTETLVKEKIGNGEVEREYSLTGVMVTADGEYALRGERTEETETEQGETETEEEITVRTYPDITDTKTYVQMEQEVSVENDETEREYVYTVVQNGKKTEETSLEFEWETENGKEEIEYKLEILTGSGRGVYTLKKVTDNDVSKIKVNYTIDGVSGSYTVTENADGSYTYTFSDGTNKTFP